MFVFWKDIKNPNHDIFNMKSGGSVSWFVTYYLTGAFIGKYMFNYTGIKKYFFCFICLMLYLFVAYLYIIIHIYRTNIHIVKINLLKNILTRGKRDSTLEIIESLTLVLFCLQLNINKYLAKIICFIGPLVFDIYLIHNHPLVRKYIISHIFDFEPKYLKIYKIILLIMLKTIKIFAYCIIIAYTRNMLFNLLKLKKACIILENNIHKIIS